MINILGWPLRQFRGVVLDIEAWAWSCWHQISVPPEYEGATEAYADELHQLLDAEPADWDEDAAFWAEWHAEMDAVEAMVRDRAHAIEVMARAFLTGGHTEDNLPIVVALAGA